MEWHELISALYMTVYFLSWWLVFWLPWHPNERCKIFAFLPSLAVAILGSLVLILVTSFYWDERASIRLLFSWVALPFVLLIIWAIRRWKIRRSDGTAPVQDANSISTDDTGTQIFAAVCSILLCTGLALYLCFHSPFMSSRRDARRYLCENNMRLIDHAKNLLADKNGLTNGQVIADTDDAIWTTLDPYVDGTNVLCCPELPPGTHYIYGPIDTTPRCPFGHDHVYNPD